MSLQRARKALDKDELQTLKDRAEYFGLDKSDSFKEFKNNYLKSSMMLETPGNVGEKAIPYSERGIEIEKRPKNYLTDLTANSDYIVGSAGDFKNQDLAILTTETGVEYTTITIGDELQFIFSVLIWVAVRASGLAGKGCDTSVPALPPEVNIRSTLVVFTTGTTDTVFFCVFH